MQAWLTAADPDSVEEHRLFFCICLAAAGLMYVLFGVLLKPRSVLHFCLCSLAVPVAWISCCAMLAHPGVLSVSLLVMSGAYLFWRVWYVLNRE